MSTVLSQEIKCKSIAKRRYPVRADNIVDASLIWIYLLSSLMLAFATPPADADSEANKTISIDATPRGQAELPTEAEIKKQFDSQEVPGILSPISPSDSVQLREPTITLKGAVEEATDLNKDIAKTRFEVARFHWDYAAVQASRLPNLRVLSYLSQPTVNSNLSVPNQANAFVFLSALMPITQQYRLGLEARAVRLGEEIAQYKLEQEIDDTMAKVKAAYYKVVLDQSKVATLNVSIKYLQELETTTTNRVKEGNSLKVDHLKVAANLAKVQLDLTRAQNTLQIDREKFNHLLGRSIDSKIVLEAVPAPDAMELDIHDAEQKALNRRPEIHAADARRRQINLEKRIRLAEYIPNVSVGAVYIALPGFSNQALPSNILAPGIFISYNAFDWGRRAFLAKAQGKAEHAEELNLASIKDDVLIDLHSQINKVTEARLSIKTTLFARDVALEDLRVSMNRYKFTSDRLAEVLAALSALADANNNYEQALLSFWQAKAEFDRAIGQ